MISRTVPSDPIHTTSRGVSLHIDIEAQKPEEYTSQRAWHHVSFGIVRLSIPLSTLLGR